MDLKDWLKANGLGKYADVFAENEIDLDLLPQLSASDLDQLGLTVGAKRRLAIAIRSLELPDQPNSAEIRMPSSAAERRHLTVMFCDLVGSTALSQIMDPEELRQLIRRFQDACTSEIARYDGHLAQFLGDGVLAYFGYPAAHEDEAERAIRTALAILDNVSELSATSSQRIQVRIGIDTGVVVIGKGAELSEQERTAVGDAPNVAARVQSLAKPDTIVVSERTRLLAPGAFDYLDLGSNLLKGVLDPVPLWQVTGAKSVETRFDAATGGKTTPMVGRDMELNIALQTWHRAEQGKPQVLLICGEAGIGKSRILRALREQLGAGHAQPWQYQCSPHFTNTALYPVIAHLERLVAGSGNDTPRDRLDRLEALFRGRFSSPDLDLNLIGQLLNLPAEDKYGPLEMSPQKQKQETLRALADAVEAGSRARPILLLYEDVHWADATTLESIECVINRERFRGLAVMTYRPEFSPSWMGQPNVTVLTLGRLDAEQTQQVATRVASNKQLPAEVVQQIVQKTDGIPLYVEELTRTVIESNLVTDHGDHFELAAAPRSLSIPTTLQDSLMARLDRLASAKEVAQIGACIGREFSNELLTLISPNTQRQLKDAIEQLVQSELVFCRGSGKDAVYVFKHALIQDAAYQSLLKASRQEYHKFIAQTYVEKFPDIVDAQPELIAYHYNEANLYELAVNYWQRAGERAVARSAIIEALGHVTKGLNLLETLSDTPDRRKQELLLQLTLGSTLAAARGVTAPETGQAFRRASDLAKELGADNELFRALHGSWRYLVMRGPMAASRQAGDELLALAEHMQDRAALLEAHRCLGTVQFYMGELDSGRKNLDRAISLYDPKRDRAHSFLYGYDPCVTAYSVIMRAHWLLGYPEKAHQSLVKGLSLAQELSHPFSMMFVLYAQAELNFFLRRVDATRTSSESLISMAKAQNFPFWLSVATVLRGWALVRQANIREGVAEIERGIDIFDSTGAVSWRPLLMGALSDAHMAANEYDKAINVCEQALETVRQTSDCWWQAELCRLKGESLLSQAPAPDEAVSCLQQSLDIARRQGAKSIELRTALSLGRVWNRSGKRADARKLLAETYGWFTEGFDSSDLADAKMLLNELSQ